MGVAEHNGVRSNFNKASGKWYWEITIDSGTTHFVGVATVLAGLDSFAGGDEHAYSYHDLDGKKYTNGAGSTYGDTYEAGDVIGVALDLDNDEVFFSKNGVWQDSGDPAAGTDPAYSITAGTYYAIWSGYDGGEVTANFGDSTFAYTAPTGFASLAKGTSTVIWDEDYMYPYLGLLNNDLTVYVWTSAEETKTGTSVLANLGKISGKWYWEVNINRNDSSTIMHNDVQVGIAMSSIDLSVPISATSGGYAYHPSGQILNDGVPQNYGDSYTFDDIIGIALDLDNHRVWFSKNGVWQDSGDPAAGTDFAFSLPSSKFFPAATTALKTIATGGGTIYWYNGEITANFGDSVFAGTIPDGFLAYNSQATEEEISLSETTTTSDEISVNVEYGSPETVHEGVLSEGFVTSDEYFATLPGESEDPASVTAASSFTVSAAITAETPYQNLDEAVNLTAEFTLEAPYQDLNENVTLGDEFSFAGSTSETPIAEDVEISSEISGAFEIEPAYPSEDVTTTEVISVTKELGTVFQSENLTTSDEISASREKGATLTQEAMIYDTLGWTWMLTPADGGSTAAITDVAEAELGLNISEWLEFKETWTDNWTGTENITDTARTGETLLFGWLKSLTSEAVIADTLTIESIWKIIEYLTARDTITANWTGTESITSFIDLKDALAIIWPLTAESTAMITDVSVLTTIYKIQEFLDTQDTVVSNWTGVEAIESLITIRDAIAIVWPLIAESIFGISDVSVIELILKIQEFLITSDSAISNWVGVEAVESFIVIRDTISIVWPKIVESTFGITDISILETIYKIREFLDAVDTATSQWSGTESVTSTLNMFGQAMIAQLFDESVTSTAAAVEVVTYLHQMISAVTSTFASTDSVSTQVDFNPVIAESIAVAGLLSVIQTLNLSISESGEIVDSLGFAWMDTLSETFAIVDATALQRTAMVLLTESLVATETALGLFNFTDTITETLQAVAAITLQQILTNTVNETINFDITILLDGELWETWVLSGNKFDMSVYSGFEFNSYAVYENQAFGCKSDGIYKLSGTTDNGTAFKSGVVLPETNFGTFREKRFRRGYFGISGTSPSIRLETDTASVTYTITDSRANISRSQKGKNWTLKIADWDSIDQVDLIPIILTR